MNYDIVLCGVGGQGGISVSVVVARAAMAESLQVKQSEVHGMAQRGGRGRRQSEGLLVWTKS